MQCQQCSYTPVVVMFLSRMNSLGQLFTGLKHVDICLFLSDRETCLYNSQLVLSLDRYYYLGMHDIVIVCSEYS